MEPSSTASYISEYMKEILEKRAFMLLDTASTMQQKKETDIGLALSAKIVQGCHATIRRMETCIARGDSTEGDCENVKMMASDCTNNISNNAIDDLINEYSRSDLCSNELAVVAESPGDSHAFESLLHCCAKRHLDTLAQQFQFDFSSLPEFGPGN